jgi:hypothetical protein
VRLPVLFTALLVAALPSLAAADDDGDGSNWGRITEVYVDAKGTVLRLQFSREVVNPGKCEGGDFYVRELDDSPGSDRFLKTVIAAHLANRKVKFWIEGCTRAKWWGKTRPQITDIYIGS